MSTETTQAAAADAPDNFAQTAAEAPVEENLTSAQEEAQAEPTNRAAAVGGDALEAAAQSAAQPTDGRQRVQKGRARNTEPNSTLYVGNLYYEVTEEQLRRVFSRFGEIANVKMVYDNRGLSRG